MSFEYFHRIRTCLFALCKEKNNDAIIDELLNDFPIESKDERGYTLLHIACKSGNNERAIKILLAKGANVNACGWWIDTPLYFACKGGHVGSIKILLDHNAETLLADHHGQNPFHIACRKGHMKAIKEFLNRGFDVDYQCDKFTALHIACRYDNYIVAEYLLYRGANTEACNWADYTPLHMACLFKSKKTISLLLKKGANVNAIGLDKVTPLMIAKKRGDQEIIDLLSNVNFNNI